MWGSGVQTAQRVQRCRAHECRGSETAEHKGAGGTEGSRVQRVQECRGCRGCRVQRCSGAGLKSAGRSKSARVQGSGVQGGRRLRDTRGAGDKGAGLRDAETTGVYWVQKVQGSWGCRGHMDAGLMSAGGSESAGHRGSEG